MIPEIGSMALCLALVVALIQGIYPLYGIKRQWMRWVNAASPLTLLQFTCVLIAYVCLTYAFITHDFTVRYVSENSNSLLPIYYRISGVWGGHEGSLLLWMLMLSGWQAAVAIGARHLPPFMHANVLAVLGWVSFGFLLFIVFASNPFARTLPDFPIDGHDLNPLLQDPGLIIHPPILYMGYVGLSVAFAFALAALMSGRLDAVWARWARPWTIAAWCFLTLGIALGSWWAYYELGWGGWWFWDPVENASLMPWIVATALIHSLAVSDKRAGFKSWTVLLAILAFSLSLLGTFLVRSGVLVSVHSFASDPTRGLFILALMVITVGSSLILYALQGDKLKGYSHYQRFSRESFLLFNNVVLLCGLVVVFIGTLFPLIHSALGLGSLSVGPPFFNQFFAYLTILFALAMGIGPWIRWRRQRSQEVLQRLGWCCFLTVSLSGLCCLLLPHWETWAVIGVSLAIWICVATLLDLFWRASLHTTLWRGLVQTPRSVWAMVWGHLGFACLVLGISITQHYSIEQDIRIKPGEYTDLGEYRFIMHTLREHQAANYRSIIAPFRVEKNGTFIADIYPEKRIYKAQGAVMTESAIHASLFRDLYVSMGEHLGGEAWAMRVHYKPFVRFIWLGALIMAFAGVLVLLDGRYRVKIPVKQQQEVESC